jgi:hypothetical protein
MKYQGMWVFENRVLRAIFESKRYEERRMDKIA